MTPEAERALRARVRKLVVLLRAWGEDLRKLEAEIAALKEETGRGEEWRNA